LSGFAPFRRDAALLMPGSAVKQNPLGFDPAS
jgi:hypothetical protein